MIAYETIDDQRRLVELRRALGAERPHGLEDVRDLDPALQGPVIARGDHRAVGDRVGIGNADLDHVRAPADQLGDQDRRRRQVGVARRHERHQGAAAFGLEAGEEGVDAVHGDRRGRTWHASVGMTGVRPPSDRDER